MFCVRKIWIGLVVINIAGISFLRCYDAFYRTIPIQNFNVLEYYYPSDSPKELKKVSANFPQKIMQNVMNSVSKGKNCNGMSELFLHALRAQGYKARKLFVVKSIGDPYATHTLVEVFEAGHWVIYDPTFNVSFKKGGRLLGAVDISKSLIDGSFKEIKPVFYGEVAYPARLETYPIYWLAHFNNVLMFKHGDYSSSWIVRNSLQLIARYWQGPVLYYFSPTGKPNDYLELINWFYFFFTCILPVFISILAGIILTLIFSKKHVSKPRQRLFLLADRILFAIIAIRLIVLRGLYIKDVIVKKNIFLGLMLLSVVPLFSAHVSADVEQGGVAVPTRSWGMRSIFGRFCPETTYVKHQTVYATAGGCGAYTLAHCSGACSDGLLPVVALTGVVGGAYLGGRQYRSQEAAKGELIGQRDSAKRLAEERQRAINGYQTTINGLRTNNGNLTGQLTAAQQEVAAERQRLEIESIRHTAREAEFTLRIRELSGTVAEGLAEVQHALGVNQGGLRVLLGTQIATIRSQRINSIAAGVALRGAGQDRDAEEAAAVVLDLDRTLTRLRALEGEVQGAGFLALPAANAQ